MDVHGVDSQTAGPAHVRNAEPCHTVEERRARDWERKRVARSTKTEEELLRRRAKAREHRRLARAKVAAPVAKEQQTLARANSRARTCGCQRAATTRAFVERTAVEQAVLETREREHIALEFANVEGSEHFACIDGEGETAHEPS